MIDQQQLARHEAGFKFFVNLMISIIVVSVVILVYLRIFHV